MKKCIVIDCGRKHRAKGLCAKHYNQLKRTGSTQSKTTKTASERFWCKVKIVKDDECWEWQASLNGNGYGAFHFNDKGINAMVFSLEESLGRKLLSGEMALHTCDNKKCVNPKHLYAGSYKDNTDDWMERVGRHGRIYKTGRMIRKNFNINFDTAIDMVADGYHESEIKNKTGISVYVIRDMKSQL